MLERISEGELYHLKKKRSTKDNYGNARVDVLNLVLDAAQAQLEADKKAIESCETTTVLDKEDDSKSYEAYLVPVKSIKEYQQLRENK